MATKITNYQCPACMGPLHFKSDSGKLECDYCGSIFTVSEIETMYAQQNTQAAQAAQAADASQTTQTVEEEWTPEGEWDVSEAGGDWGADAGSLRVYNCPSCGAELLCEETTAATSCPYCGNPSIIPGQLSGSKKPDYIIPFRLDKNAAIAALKDHYRGKPFLPKQFSRENHLEEIKGVYVPFWLFDARADGDITFHATRVHTRRAGDYEETITDHFRVRRAGSAEFRRIPVDGSSQMPDDHMDSIEPFDYGELQPFSLSYLPGYLADKYDVTAEESEARADERCSASIRDILRSDVHGYATVTPGKADVILQRGQVKYALLPVWMLNTRWQDRNYLFAMNGQTGKLVGDLPVSKGKFWGALAGITALGTVLFHFLGVGSFVWSLLSEFL